MDTTYSRAPSTGDLAQEKKKIQTSIKEQQVYL